MKIKINQIECGHNEMFRRAFKAKHKLVNYSKKNEPVIFFGCYYDKQLNKLLSHESDCVVIWTGSDIQWALEHPEYIKKLKDKKNITHIAISNFIENDLMQSGIPYKSIPVMAMPQDNLIPCRLGDAIYCYKCKTSKYGDTIFAKIQDGLKDMQFIHCYHNTYSRDDLLKIYGQCFIGLRFTQHDGLSNTACELGLMGRKIIWNGNTPNRIPYDRSNIDAIIKTVKNEYDNRHHADYMDVAVKMKKYLDVPDDYLYV